ncbi:hypothetical protein ACRALDRAFT_207761 [Sodiomyces alcalophilus JCM 7366]|uniref:uncharacterized protein n=1 Tax=Sodiomyces alcalophilus JCM 7366 TaxID=591952 RepID=UPI0039B69ACD
MSCRIHKLFEEMADSLSDSGGEPNSIETPCSDTYKYGVPLIIHATTIFNDVITWVKEGRQCIPDLINFTLFMASLLFLLDILAPGLARLQSHAAILRLTSPDACIHITEYGHKTISVNQCSSTNFWVRKILKSLNLRIPNDCPVSALYNSTAFQSISTWQAKAAAPTSSSAQKLRPSAVAQGVKSGSGRSHLPRGPLMILTRCESPPIQTTRFVPLGAPFSILLTPSPHFFVDLSSKTHPPRQTSKGVVRWTQEIEGGAEYSRPELRLLRQSSGSRWLPLDLILSFVTWYTSYKHVMYYTCPDLGSFQQPDRFSGNGLRSTAFRARVINCARGSEWSTRMMFID